MCSLRHPQYRWDDRRIQPRPDHSAGGNSERETEDASPSSNTPIVETTPTYGATRSDTTPNTCGTAPMDSNKEKEGFNNWGGRGYDDFVPGEVTITAPSGDETT